MDQLIQTKISGNQRMEELTHMQDNKEMKIWTNGIVQMPTIQHSYESMFLLSKSYRVDQT